MGGAAEYRDKRKGLSARPHDEAWHWAMRALHGELYPVEHPELMDPPDAYHRAAD